MLDVVFLASLNLNHHARPVPPLRELHPVRREIILKQDGYPQYRRGYRGLPYYSPDSVLRPRVESAKPPYREAEECTCPPNVQCIKC